MAFLGGAFPFHGINAHERFGMNDYQLSVAQPPPNLSLQQRYALNPEVQWRHHTGSELAAATPPRPKSLHYNPQCESNPHGIERWAANSMRAQAHILNVTAQPHSLHHVWRKLAGVLRAPVVLSASPRLPLTACTTVIIQQPR